MRKWVLNLWESQHALPGTDVYRSLALRVGQVEVCPGVEEQQCHVGVVPGAVNDGDDGDGNDHDHDHDDADNNVI